MSNIRKITSISVAAGLLAGGIAIAAPASADPVTSSFALVGSDTLQDSVNALVNGTSITGTTVRVTAKGNAMGSYDAFGSATIRTKTTGAYFTRPSGSGAGVTALRASARPVDPAHPENNQYLGINVSGQVDIARSSSNWGKDSNGVTNQDDDNGKLLYVPFGRDAVSYAYKPVAGTYTDTLGTSDTGDDVTYTWTLPQAESALGSLTTANLTDIYSWKASSHGGQTYPVIGGVVIKPRLPQADSGTRSFFLSTIGVTTVGDAVPANDSAREGGLSTGKTLGPAENTATVLGDNELIPFSVASWIAQADGAAPSTLTAAPLVELGHPNGATPVDSGTLNGATVPVPNAAFYAGSFGRDTYLVVEYARYTSTTDSSLKTAIDALTVFPANPLPGSAGAVKKAFGFLAPNSTVKVRAFATL